MRTTEPPPWLELTAERGDGTGAVPGAGARTRAELFTRLAETLDLPGYFGRNWDALADCLLDLVEAGPLTLTVEDADQLLGDEPPAQLAALLDVFGDAWSHGRHPVRVVLRTGPERLPELRRRVTATG
ncbi:barstar family protein [Micromonospora halophytica]|uniref:Barstar (Barnase inhibitor) n=1 Tax=Micromonospora halophytica TaxID=47864 RepID=A0A1C5HIH0_9ACTN|nr:barstar family protein [Micromonospora halophytica]SCG45816.1 Barstar (barnase inhibitor) [Micromonospora halophytica]